MTKEPKLQVRNVPTLNFSGPTHFSFINLHHIQGAKRIVPEWVDLDAEARLVTARILGEEVESSETVTPSSSVPDTSQSNHQKDEL